ncbi:MAG: cyclodeaminase/cyclohydrolase family protein [Lachnospira sp.]
MMTDMNMNEFLEVLSSKEPVPGGGGAAGYVAAIGMGLGNMVLALTTGKKKYAEYQEEIEELIVKADELTKKLAECMDKDAESFEPLSKAYGLPRDTKEQIKVREEVMEKALVAASEAPLAMMETIMEALLLIDRIAQIGSRIAISDAGVGTVMCKAAMQGASLNVYINTKLMRNRKVADAMNIRADELVTRACGIADKTFDQVLNAVRPD